MPILQWLDKDKHIQAHKKIPYRILNPDSSLSYGDDDSENILIQGDNLDALKSLLPYYAGKVKCIFIDPPYNTGNAFEHYDDNIEHSIWMGIMYPRLVLLRELLSEDGFVCVHIDDAQGAYVKVLLDEIFGRANYQSTFYIQVRYPEKTLKEDMAYHKEVEYVHIYGKSNLSKPYQKRKDTNFDKFNIHIEEIRSGKKIELGGKKVSVFQPNEYRVVKNNQGFKDGLKEIWASGSILDGNSSGRFFRDYLTGKEKEYGLGVLYRVDNIGDDIYPYRYFSGPKKHGATKGKYYQGVPLNKRDGNTQKEVSIENFYDFAGSFGNCRLEGDVSFRSGKKPEKYVMSILSFFSREGDLVLDSFLGSGTTSAVAHKMGRGYIGIEMGEHAKTHCVPRMQKVVEGEQGGISKDIDWTGGGGFKFYTLGDSIFTAEGKINPNVRFATLASHIWFAETKNALAKSATEPLLGIDNGKAYVLLYNGILGDKRPNGGNVLARSTLQIILDALKDFSGNIIVYGESCRLSANTLQAHQITFKQTPYDVKV